LTRTAAVSNAHKKTASPLLSSMTVRCLASVKISLRLVAAFLRI
jgi:hypothetical protein